MTTRTCSCGREFEPLSGTDSCGACILRPITPEPEPATGVPDRIESFDVVGRIGRGAMGEILLAEQQEPFRRVAIKVVRSDIGGDAASRLRNELGALGAMQHPNIATAHSGGTLPDGRPYIVMEYVEGVPILAFADAARLTLSARVKLFLQVCDAIVHAHQRGVLHRDIKPSNVLVADIEGVLRVKVVDFGIARALGNVPVDVATLTVDGRIVGTTPYMSPEQTVPGEVVDTRADVYGLGALLYELLVGHPPLPVDDDSDILDQVRLVRDVTPQEPSVAIADGDITRDRSTTLGRARTELRKDLDWIVLKCLEKPRKRRYATAAALADDLERHLDHRPVVARPPSWQYRLSKFVRRNPTAVGLGSVACAVSIVAMVALVQWIGERSRADAQADTAIAVAEFLFEIFGHAEPRNSRGHDITVREAVEISVDKLLATVRGPGAVVLDPGIRSQILDQLIRVHLGLRQCETAKELLDEGLPMRRGIRDGDPVALASMLNTAGNVQHFCGGDLDFARDSLEEALELETRHLGPRHWATAHTLADLGDNAWFRGDFDDAESYYEHALEIRIELDRYIEVATTLRDLADIAGTRRQWDRAIELYDQAIARYREHGELRSVWGEVALHNYGRLLLEMRRPDKAEETLALAHKVCRDIRGPGDSNCHETSLYYAWSRYELGADDEATALVRAIIADPGKQHPIRAFARLALETMEGGTRESLQAVLEAARQTEGREPYSEVRALLALSSKWNRTDDTVRAAEARTEALAILEECCTVEHPLWLGVTDGTWPSVTRDRGEE